MNSSFSKMSDPSETNIGGPLLVNKAVRTLVLNSFRILLSQRYCSDFVYSYILSFINSYN